MAINYTVVIHEPDENGHVYFSSSVPGLHMFGKNLASAAPMIERMVAQLRQDNGDERVNEMWRSPAHMPLCGVRLNGPCTCGATS